MPPETAIAAQDATVVVLADWPRLGDGDRAALVELTIGSLGWGSRFGEEFAPVLLGPDADDDTLPSGVAMYAAPASQVASAALPAAARVAVALGPVDARLSRAADAIRAAGLPVVRLQGGPAVTDADWCARDAAALVDTVFALQAGELPTRATRASTPRSAATAAPDVRVAFEPPPVSIVIPSYNRAGYLRETIASCVAQDYPHCRIVVADDGSTDGTGDMVRGLGVPALRLVSNPHVGAPANRNLALAGIDTPYILWVGDDDLLVPGCVSSRVAKLAQVPDADVVHGDLLRCNAALEPEGQNIGEDWSARPEALLATLFHRNPIAEGGALVHMRVFARAGWYDPAFPRGHDYHLWSRLALRAKFVYVPGVAYIWRWHGANMGLGGGTAGPHPYADAHRRIVLELWTRHDKRLLFPQVPWDTIPAAQQDGVGALLMADRLGREAAWEDALRFARLAATLGLGTQAQPLIDGLRQRMAASAQA